MQGKKSDLGEKWELNNLLSDYHKFSKKPTNVRKHDGLPSADAKVV